MPQSTTRSIYVCRGADCCSSPSGAQPGLQAALLAVLQLHPAALQPHHAHAVGPRPAARVLGLVLRPADAGADYGGAGGTSGSDGRCWCLDCCGCGCGWWLVSSVAGAASEAPDAVDSVDSVDVDEAGAGPPTTVTVTRWPEPVSSRLARSSSLAEQNQTDSTAAAARDMTMHVCTTIIGTRASNHFATLLSIISKFQTNKHRSRIPL